MASYCLCVDPVMPLAPTQCTMFKMSPRPTGVLPVWSLRGGNLLHLYPEESKIPLYITICNVLLITSAKEVTVCFNKSLFVC